MTRYPKYYRFFFLAAELKYHPSFWPLYCSCNPVLPPSPPSSRFHSFSRTSLSSLRFHLPVRVVHSPSPSVDHSLFFKHRNKACWNVMYSIDSQQIYSRPRLHVHLFKRLLRLNPSQGHWWSWSQTLQSSTEGGVTWTKEPLTSTPISFILYFKMAFLFLICLETFFLCLCLFFVSFPLRSTLFLQPFSPFNGWITLLIWRQVLDQTRKWRARNVPRPRSLRTLL